MRVEASINKLEKEDRKAKNSLKKRKTKNRIKTKIALGLTHEDYKNSNITYGSSQPSPLNLITHFLLFLYFCSIVKINSQTRTQSNASALCEE